jgi:hypothetical protein
MKTTSRKRMAMSGVLAATLVGGAGMLMSPSSLAQSAPTAPTAPNAEKLPSGMDIINKFVDATGGKDAYQQRTSYITKANLEIPMAGITADMTIYMQAPNKMATKLDLGQFGSQQTVTDGTDAWEISTMTGPRLLTDAEKASLQRQAAFDVQFNPEKYYESIETVQKTEFADEPAYEVKLTTKDGNTVTQYYSVESSLLLGQSSKEQTQMGEMESTVTMSDYRDAGGVKVPFKTVIEIPSMGMTQNLTITNIDTETKIDPAVFAMPDEIKQLKDQQKK